MWNVWDVTLRFICPVCSASSETPHWLSHCTLHALLFTLSSGSTLLHNLYILHTSHTTTPHHTANSTYYASHSTLQALWNLHPTLHTLQSEPYEQQFILDFRWLPPLHSTNHTPDAIQVIAWHNRLILTYFNQTGQGWRRMRRLTESGKVAKNQQRLKKGFPFCFGFASAGLSCRSAFGYLCSAMPHILNRFVFA